MQNASISEFLRRVPKTDLHVHLDGSLRISTLIELAKTEKIDLPSYDEEGLKKTVFKDTYKDLPDYLQGFAYTVAVLQTPENMARVAYELAQDNIAEGVRYLEVRFAPQLHLRKGFSMEEVVGAVCAGMEQAKKEHEYSEGVRSGSDLPFEYGIIFCALRYFNSEMSPYYKGLFRVMPTAPEKEVFAAASLELARSAVRLRREDGFPVVAFDLAGAESGFPAEDHAEAFQWAHSQFLHKTVHAGEAYGPESIFQAITLCQANRIGHGTFLFDADMVGDDPRIPDKQAYVENLAQYIANQRITIEVCLTSNLQTLPSMASVKEHALKKMIDRHLSVSICTDNRLVSNTTVTRELELVVDNVPLTRRQLRNLVVAGFKGSFYPGRYLTKRAYVRRVIDRYQQLERELWPDEDDQKPVKE